MIHWTLKLLVRMLPSGIPICFLMVAVWLFYSQNQTSYSRDGDFTLNSDEEMSERYPRHIAGDEKPNPSAEVTPRELVSVSVARKYLLTRRAGLSFWHRGHSASFVAEIPEFSDDSKFLRQLNRQLRDEHERMADEFTTIDWSLVYDGFRDPQFYLRNWEGLIGINIVHSFYFSPYHVGCYAEGTYTVHVPYSVIRDCIPENSPARLFMCEDKR